MAAPFDLTAPGSGCDEIFAHVGPLDMRRAMGRMTTGVAIVWVEHRNEVYGMTVNSLTSVSLSPPILLVCLDAGARTLTAIEREGRFAISILAKGQASIARTWSRDGATRILGGGSSPQPSAPTAPQALVHAECVVERLEPVGDHVVVFGLVQDLRDREGPPLTFHAGQFDELPI